LKRVLLPLMIVMVFLILWQTVETYVNELRFAEGRTSLEFFIPTPLTIVKAGFENYKTIFRAMQQTLIKASAGFGIGAFLGISMAVMYSLTPALRSATLPIAFALQSFPIVGIAPVIILAFGQDSFMSIVIVSVILVYFPILLSLDDAFTNMNKEYTELATVYNASKWQMIRLVKLPLASPSLFTALKLAAPSSIVGATIGEWLGSSSGIGRMITLAIYQLKPGILYSCLVILAIVSASTVLVINLVERLCFSWILLQSSREIS